MTISQYFTKVKPLCDEIRKVVAESTINEARTRRIIIRDLDPKYSDLVKVTRGWATQLFSRIRILASQEDLDRQRSKVSIKEEENALFIKRRALQRQG